MPKIALTHSSRTMLAAKLVALAVFLFATNQGLGKRSLVGYAFFFGAWLCCLISVGYVAFASSRGPRLAWTVLVVLSAAVGSGFSAVYETTMTFSDFDKLLSVAVFVGDALDFYGTMLVRPLALCALGFVAMNLPPFVVRATLPSFVRRRSTALSLQALPVLVMVGVLCAKHGEGTNGLPVQYTSLSFLSALAVERMVDGPTPPRRSVTLAHSGERPLRHIVVVMDESIRGDLLDLNAPNGATTGLRGRPDVVNFGVMSAIANCSHESNAAFRYGIGRHDYLKQLASNPSIWAYAKNAGYATYYFDAQRTGGALQNGMDRKERAEIDHFFQVGPDVAPQDRDIELARAMRDALSEAAERPTFFYVNKMGAHYPYEGKYPPEETRFRPVLQRDYFGNEADPKHMLSRFAADPRANDPETRVRFKNSYMNAVSWNTRRFFETLLTDLDLSSTLVVYMADHAQDLHEDGRPGHATHCTTGDAHPDEGRVPLAFVTAHEGAASVLREAAARNFDRVSAFGVFPSVLGWMGYSREAIAQGGAFDPPIEASPEPDNQRFLSTFFTRLGGKPVWNDVPPRTELATAVGAEETRR